MLRLLRLALLLVIPLVIAPPGLASQATGPGRFQMDHVVILVDRLDQAVRDFESLGFKVQYGGEHDNGITHNALIFFQNEAFIELMAIKTKAKRTLIRTLQSIGALHLLWPSTFYHRFAPRLANPEGFIELGFLGVPFEQAMDTLKHRGLKISGAKTLSRQRPDGTTLSWQVSTPSNESVPFVRSIALPETSPGSDEVNHPNGTVGIARITVPVLRWEKALRDYEKFFGQKALGILDLKLGVRIAEFTARGTTIAVADAKGNETLTRFIEAGGERPFELLLRSDAAQELSVLDPTRSHGARLLLTPAKTDTQEAN